jgi:hypothetical protein
MDCDDPCPHAPWWGGTFEGLKKTPISLTDPANNDPRIVFSPQYVPGQWISLYI